MRVSRWQWSLCLIVVALALAFIAQTRGALVASPYFEGETGSFRYTGQGQSNGSYYVTISVDFDNPIARKDYLDANRERGQTLLSPYAVYPAVSYTHLRAHETVLDIVCRLLLEKKKKNKPTSSITRQR